MTQRVAVPPTSVGPRTVRARLRRIDGRTREGQFIRETERQLIAHLGGPEHVTAPQRFLIERVATDLLRLSLYDVKLARGDNITDLDGRNMHALRGAVRLALRELGMKGPPSSAPHQQTLDEIAAEIIANREVA